jgi:hypothetical protein
MWKITTCSFTLQEVLIMAAMNVAPALKAPDKGKGNDLAQQRAPRFTRARRLSWQK